MNPRDFQALAVRLLRGPTPAELRSATGRAYYAAFHVARDWLIRLGIRVSKGGAAHGEVQICLENSGAPEIAEAGSALRRLHAHRIRAHYRLDVPDAEKAAFAEQAVESARDIITILDKPRSSSELAKIQSTIAAWRRANGYP